MGLRDSKLYLFYHTQLTFAGILSGIYALGMMLVVVVGREIEIEKEERERERWSKGGWD